MTDAVTRREVPPPPPIHVPLPPDAVATILTRAVVLLEQDGWCTGRAHERRGDSMAHCIGGAVTLAAGFYAQTLMHAHGIVAGTADGRACHRDVWDAATSRLREHLDTGEVGDWNDRPGRTFAQVVNALRDAAR